MRWKITPKYNWYIVRIKDNLKFLINRWKRDILLISCLCISLTIDLRYRKVETSEESDNKKNEKTSRGEIELVVENENENENEDDYDVERCNNEEEQSTVSYKLRASLATDADNDWIRAPKFFDEEQISQLTNEQIKTTLDYFSKSIPFYYYLGSNYIQFLNFFFWWLEFSSLYHMIIAIDNELI